MSKIRFLFSVLVLCLVIAGCGSKPTKEAEAPVLQVGMIDSNKAIKGHPKYKNLMELGQQAETLMAQLQAARVAADKQLQEKQSQLAMPQAEVDALNQGFEQEFNTKMTAKQDELNPRIMEKADVARQTVSAEFEEYQKQLEKDDQPELFNLQLKLRKAQSKKDETDPLTTKPIVSMEDDAATIQADIDKLEAKHAEAVAAKQQELVARMDELVLPEKALVEQELASYATEIQNDIAQRVAKKQAEIAKRGQAVALDADTENTLSTMEQNITKKQQEAQALQGFILEDIRTKTGKVAAQDTLEVVLTNIAVNISAVDITDKVITECNK